MLNKGIADNVIHIGTSKAMVTHVRTNLMLMMILRMIILNGDDVDLDVDGYNIGWFDSLSGVIILDR